MELTKPPSPPSITANAMDHRLYRLGELNCSVERKSFFSEENIN